MFKIENISLFNNDKSYSYILSEGINYFQGKNDTGKTVFFNFIDFMFGATANLSDKEWFKGTLTKASLVFSYNSIKYYISRSANGELNIFRYYDDTTTEEFIDLDEYKHRINSVFRKDEIYDKALFTASGEHLTYRAFTMFNFIEEIGQGQMHDFLTKCKEPKYSFHLVPILNFLFNNNLDKITELLQLLDINMEKLKELEKKQRSSQHIIEQVNNNLRILNISERFTGRNIKEIEDSLNNIKALQKDENNNSKTITELVTILNSIDEQIKTYKKAIGDAKSMKKENEHRKKLLDSLNEIVAEKSDYEYLADPIVALISQLDKNISFQRLIIEDKTVRELEKKRNELIEEIHAVNNQYKRYSYSEKEKAFIFIEKELTEFVLPDTSEISDIEKRIKELRKSLRELQNQDDNSKIRQLSDYINELYFACTSISAFVNDDCSKNKFRIEYIKKGNIISPTVKETVNGDEVTVSYDVGSLARHTLMQLNAYLSFLKFILEDERSPIIPFLVIDHISKPFDKENLRTIGTVICKFIEDIGKDNVQIIIFDDKDPSALNITPDVLCHLQNEEESKSGFNPFFFKENSTNS